MNLSSTVIPIRTVNWSVEIVDEAIHVTHLRTNKSHVLNPIAYFIWERCDGNHVIGDISSKLQEIYPESGDEVSSAVTSSITDLFNRELVSFDTSTGSLRQFLKVAGVNFGTRSEAQGHYEYLLKILAYRFTLVLVDVEADPNLVIYQGELPKRANLEEATTIELCHLTAINRQRNPSLRLVYSPNYAEFGANVGPDWLGTKTAVNQDDRNLRENEFELKTNDLKFAEELLEFLDPTEHEPVADKPRLTIAMAVYEDYDGVFFSIENILMNHAEVSSEIEFLVVDNNPGGAASGALRRLATSIKSVRYVPNQSVNGTAIRSVLFDLATADYVLCIDCHVLLAPGAVANLIQYYEANPDTNDLIQGPMLTDDLSSAVTHMEPLWKSGMYGVWARDSRIETADEPFEIPMHGLGLFSCRKAAWPGFNPLFYGFGGEEGYLHQKFRNLGAKTLCLPSLKWLHRFERPNGTPYSINWEDRIRNYLIGFSEVGLNTDEVETYFSNFLDSATVARVKAMMLLEKSSPFNFVDQAYFLVPHGEEVIWQQNQKRFAELGLRFQIKRINLKAEIADASDHRTLIEIAHQQESDNILILEHGFELPENFRTKLRELPVVINSDSWDVLYLEPLSGLEGVLPLDTTTLVSQLVTETNSKARVYNADNFEKLLQALPRDHREAEKWNREGRSLHSLLKSKFRQICLSPDGNSAHEVA